MQNGSGEPSSMYRWHHPSRIPQPDPLLAEDDGDDYTSSSSEDVTEDEDGEELTPALDAAILRTLAKIKSGQGVYGSEAVLEQELAAAQAEASRRGVKVAPARKAEEKPFLLADHHRKALLSGDAKRLADEEDWPEPEPITHVQEQRQMRREAIEAFKSFGGDEEAGGEDEVFEPVRREIGEEERGKEEEEYRRFLLEMGGGEEQVRKLLGMGDSGIKLVRVDDGDGSDVDGEEADKGKKVKRKKAEKKAKKQQKEDDDFLMNYILNRGWIDKSGSQLPTYTDITGAVADASDEESNAEAGPSHPWGQLDEDEFDDKAEEFETEYNFRFEEPGASEITSHPRLIPSLVRRPDDKRKLQREAKAARKAEQKAQQAEAEKAAKGKKRRQVEKQIDLMRQQVGEEEWDTVKELFEGEWDEGVWEAKVGQFLERIADKEEGKPEWDDSGDERYEYEDGVEEINGHAEGQPAGGVAEDEDGPINMDADFIGFEDEPRKSKKSKKAKKDKKRKRDAEADVDDAEAELDGEDAHLSLAGRAEKVKAAMESYKALDHEDVIGDLPTRFHYTQTAPTSFGLTPAEILLATDEELNSVLAIKHYAPYSMDSLSGGARAGMNKKVKELRDVLASRRWGEEPTARSGSVGGRKVEGSREGKRKVWDGKNGEKGERRVEGGMEGKKKRRIGKNAREKKKRKEERVAAAAGALGP